MREGASRALLVKFFTEPSPNLYLTSANCQPPRLCDNKSHLHGRTGFREDVGVLESAA